MQIFRTVQDKTYTYLLEGRLDSVSAPDLEQLLKKDLPQIEELIFDFEKLEYITSAGLRILLISQRAMNTQGTMTVRNTPEIVRKILDTSGFSDILHLE